MGQENGRPPGKVSLRATQQILKKTRTSRACQSVWWGRLFEGGMVSSGVKVSIMKCPKKVSNRARTSDHHEVPNFHKSRRPAVVYSLVANSNVAEIKNKWKNKHHSSIMSQWRWKKTPTFGIWREYTQSYSHLEECQAEPNRGRERYKQPIHESLLYSLLSSHSRLSFFCGCLTL